MIKPARRLHNTIIRNLQHHNQLFRMSQKILTIVINQYMMLPKSLNRVKKL